MMVGNHEALAVGAVRQTVHMAQGDRLRARCCGRREKEHGNHEGCEQMMKGHRFSELRMISARAAKTSAEIQWLLM
jgi:hypothetical protein